MAEHDLADRERCGAETWAIAREVLEPVDPDAAGEHLEVDVLALPDQARVPGLGGGVGEHDVTQRIAGTVAVEQGVGPASAN